MGIRAFSTSTSRVEHAKSECWSMYITFLAVERTGPVDHIPCDASSAITAPSAGPLRFHLGIHGSHYIPLSLSISREAALAEQLHFCETCSCFPYPAYQRPGLGHTLVHGKLHTLCTSVRLTTASHACERLDRCMENMVISPF
jgi:hypothetical protein